jgi:hypothetical protein
MFGSDILLGGGLNLGGVSSKNWIFSTVPPQARPSPYQPRPAGRFKEKAA